MIQPGDVILVHRRSTWRAWLRHPISSLISARIRATTGSKWNHVACVVGVQPKTHPVKSHGHGVFEVVITLEHHIVEAEWNKGVVSGILEDCYPPDQYEIAVAKPPAEVDREAAVAFWKLVASSGKAKYDWRSIAMMKFAAIIGGHKAIAKYVVNSEGDDLWICSEVGAAGWHNGGMRDAYKLIKDPGSFERYRV